MPSTADWFALVAGVFAAGVVGPPAAVGLALLVPGVPWYWWLLLGTGAGFVGGVGGARATVSLATTERFRSDRHVAALFAVPVVLALGGLVVHFWTALDPVAVWASVAVGAALAFVGTLGMHTAASRLYADHAVSESAVELPLPPTEHERTNRTERVALGTAVALVVAAVAVLGLLGESVPWFVLFAAVPAVVPLLPSLQERFVVDAGIKTETLGGRSVGVEPWTEFAGFALTDDELRIERESRWQQDLVFPREEFDDEDEIVAVLAEHLSRR